MSAKPTSRPGTQSKQQRPRRRARWATLLAIAPLFACAAPLAAASTLIGQPGDGLPDYVYDPATGGLTFNYDGATFLTNEGLPSYLASLFVASASGSIRYDNATPSFKSGTGATFTSTLLASLLLDGVGFTDGFDLGLVLPTGLSPVQLTQDLTLNYQVLNGGSLKPADVAIKGVAGTVLYTGPSGDWSTGPNWSTGQPPLQYQSVKLSPASGNLVINLDAAANGVAANLILDASSGASVTLNQAQNTLSVVSNEVIGDTGAAAFVQSGGTHVVGNSLTLARGDASIASYSLSGGTLSVLTEKIGTGGTFNQTGGTHAVNSPLNNAFTSAGGYNLAGGAFVVNGGAVMNRFNQTGGDARFGGSLTLNGTSTLAGGSLNAATLRIANRFNFTGGTLSVGTLNNAGDGLTGPIFSLSGAGTRTVDGTVDNSGIVQVTATTARFTGTFINSGSYVAHDADSYFQTLQIGRSASFTAGPNDRFFINGDLLVTGEATFKSTGGEVHFSGGGTHQYLAPLRNGTFPTMMVDPADTLNILSGSVAKISSTQASSA